MTLHLQVPCEGPELTDVVIRNDGEMEFLDYDIEHDLVLAEMGEEPTLCAEVYLSWEQDSLDFICDSVLVPIDLVGRIMTRWCKEAISLTKDELEEMGCYKALIANAKACASFWTAKKPSIKRVYQTKLDIVNCWNKYARDKSSSVIKPGLRRRPFRVGVPKVRVGIPGGAKMLPGTAPTLGEDIVEAVIENTMFILDIVRQKESTGGIYEFPKSILVHEGSGGPVAVPTKACTALKTQISNIIWGDIFTHSDRPMLDKLIEYDKDKELAEDIMFELAMEEIKRYQR